MTGIINELSFSFYGTRRKVPVCFHSIKRTQVIVRPDA